MIEQLTERNLTLGDVSPPLSNRRSSRTDAGATEIGRDAREPRGSRAAHGAERRAGAESSRDGEADARGDRYVQLVFTCLFFTYVERVQISRIYNCKISAVVEKCWRRASRTTKRLSVNSESSFSVCRSQSPLLFTVKSADLSARHSDLEQKRTHQATQQTESQSLTSQSQTMLNLNLKLQSSMLKGQVKTIDLGMRKLDARQALEHLAIVKVRLITFSFRTEADSALRSRISYLHS